MNKELIKKFIPSEINENAQVYIFGFPRTGTFPAIFDRFTSKLGEDICMVPVNFPGKADRHAEKPFDSLEEQAAAAAEIINEISGSRRVVLFGDELGALCAFRTAQLLKKDYSRAVERLIVTGIVPPSEAHKVNENVHLMSDEGITEHLRAMKDKPLCVARFVNDDEALKMLMHIIRADYTALETYEYDPSIKLDCDISVMYGSREENPETAELWGNETNGETTLTAFDRTKMIIQDIDLNDEISEYLEDQINGSK